MAGECRHQNSLGSQSVLGNRFQQPSSSSPEPDAKRAKYGNKAGWEEPPQSFIILGSHTQFSAWEIAVIVLYNGTSGCPFTEFRDSNGRIQFPWIYNPNGAHGSKWQFTDNTNPKSKEHYATKIITRFWEKVYNYKE